MDRLPLLAALTALVLPLACAQSHGPQMRGAEAYPEGSAEAYAQALDTWTREARTFDGVATSIILKGTLQSPAFMEAYGAELARLRLLPEAEGEEVKGLAVGEVQGGVHILFTLQAPKHRQLRLDRPQEAAEWNVRLSDGEGRSAEPIAIAKVLTPNELAPSLLYPYITRWDDAFVATFPEAPEGGAPFLDAQGGDLTFLVAGPIGAAQLMWDLPAGAASARVAPILPEPEAPLPEAEVDPDAPL